ncbi:MAG: hypothetical protein MUD08_19630 [Cytophagales bacterium]|nr:hypothetical protein [Cytophagales bacterium]
MAFTVRRFGYFLPKTLLSQAGVTPRRDAYFQTGVRWSQTDRFAKIVVNGIRIVVNGIRVSQRFKQKTPKTLHRSSDFVDTCFCKLRLRPADAGLCLGTSGRLRQFPFGVLGVFCPKRFFVCGLCVAFVDTRRALSLHKGFFPFAFWAKNDKFHRHCLQSLPPNRLLTKDL